jgi:glutathione S-transferase
MAMLKIWGRPNSINVRKVLWVAQELELKFQLELFGKGFAAVDTPEYKRINPHALVPAIDDDGCVLWESNVIVRYLCAKHGLGSLYPEPLAARFAAERWMDWQQTTLNRAGRDAFWQLIRTPAAQRDAALIERSIAATEPLFALLDAELARRPFIAGEQFTMADIPIGCEVQRFWNLPIAHQQRPHLARWYAQLLARPATRGVLDQELT